MKLLRTIKIYLVFYVLLLEPIPLGVPRALVIEIEPVNPDAEYEVDQILDCKMFRGRPKYLVR